VAGRAPGTQGLCQAASLHLQRLGTAGACSDKRAGRALGRLSGLGGRGTGWVRPRLPRLIKQPVNTQQGEGAEGRRPDGKRGGKPEPRPSCRKWGLMWEHPVQQGLGPWPSAIAPSTTEASSAQGGAACLGTRPRTGFLISQKDMINGSLLWVALPPSPTQGNQNQAAPVEKLSKRIVQENLILTGNRHHHCQ
jgi:hypothetical protein